MRKQNLFYFCILTTLLVTILFYSKSSIASLSKLMEANSPRGIPEYKLSRVDTKNSTYSSSNQPKRQSQEQESEPVRTIYVKKLLPLTIIKPCQKIDYKILHEQQGKDLDPGFLIDANQVFELSEEIDGCNLLINKYE